MSKFKIRIFTMGFCLLLLLLALTKAATAESTEVVFEAPWGDKAGEIGLLNRPEHEQSGPLTFCVDGRNVFVLDTVHKQIVAIDANGQSKVMATNVVGWNVCGDGHGGVFVQDDKGIISVNAKGEIKEHVESKGESIASPEVIKGYGMEMFLDAQGYVCLKTLSQKVRRVSAARSSPSSSSPSALGSTVSVNYRIKRMSGNEVRIIGLDEEGKVMVSVPVLVDGGKAGAVLFKGRDANGNLCVELENLKENNVELEVHRYSTSGKRLGVLHLPNNYFTTVYKKTEVCADGSVYQMLTIAEGTRILRWKF